MSTKKNTTHRNLRIDHRWIAIVIIIPLFITTVTGVFLLLRQQINWIQPETIKQTKVETWATMDQVLRVITRDNSTHIKTWEDVNSIIYKPSKGTIQLRTKRSTLIQLNGTTAKILSIQARRTGWLIQLHEGSYWGKGVRQYIFLPSAIGLLLLLISGVLLIFNHYSRKFKKNYPRG